MSKKTKSYVSLFRKSEAVFTIDQYFIIKTEFLTIPYLFKSGLTKLAMTQTQFCFSHEHDPLQFYNDSAESKISAKCGIMIFRV